MQHPQAQHWPVDGNAMRKPAWLCHAWSHVQDIVLLLMLKESCHAMCAIMLGAIMTKINAREPAHLKHLQEKAP